MQQQAQVRAQQLWGQERALERVLAQELEQVRERLWALQRWHHHSQVLQWQVSKSCCASIRQGCFSRLHQRWISNC